MTAPGVTFAGLGHAVPERVVTNAEIETHLGIEPGWIERRTGIRERRFATDEEALSDLAVPAGQMALSECGVAPEDIALLVLATSTPDHLLPPTAPLVAHKLGLKNAGAIDLAGACAGFLYALSFAEASVRRQGRPVLVIAANILSRRTNPNERASAILFADAAGAVVLAPTGDANAGIRGINLIADGSGYDLIKIPAGGSQMAFRNQMAVEATRMHLSDGKAVFQRAVAMMAGAAGKALAGASLSADDIDVWVPHQANSRIMAAVTERLGIAPAKLLSSIERYGNSSAATIPLTLSDSFTNQRPAPGTKILMAAAGAGMTGGALVFQV